MRPLDLIVIHCSNTPSNVSYSAKQLEKDELKHHNSTSPFHFYIRKDGLVYAMREIDYAGASGCCYHTNSIDVCYEGGLDPQGKACDTRTLKQKSMLHSLIGRLKKEFGIHKVIGFRDLARKECGNLFFETTQESPCFNVEAEDY